MKKIANHNLYEIWNEWDADSAFCEGKPTKEDLLNISITMKWIKPDEKTHLWLEYLHVYKLTPFFKRAEKILKECAKCDGTGFIKPCSQSSFRCWWCKGKGKY